jgi:hypothetical protein
VSALGWDPGAPLRVVVGSPAPDAAEELIADLRREADRAGQDVLVGVQGSRLIVLLSEPPGLDTGGDIGTIIEAFGPGPVVVGPRVDDITVAHVSARDALAGWRAAPGWPDAPRPVAADDLLPERALAGDPVAHRKLADDVVGPIAAAGGELLHTLGAFLDGGGALESCARALFVHPNTVRYRLRRVSELTGLHPTVPRDALVLRVAVIATRLGRTGPG